MSASSLTRTRWRPQVPASCGTPARQHLTSILVGLTLLVGLVGCGEASTAAAPEPSIAPVATPTPTPVDEQAELLAQYRKFWATLTPVSRMPAANRRAALAELAVDPALKSLLAGMTQADAKGQVFYGAAVPRPVARINPDATTALVDDCQDGSHAGIENAANGAKLTKGVARNHVSVTMKKQPGAPWKVAFVDYAKSPC